MTALVLAAGCHGHDGGECTPYRASAGPPDCRDLGEPCSGCASYVDVPASCAGQLVIGEDGQAACEMDESVAKWCAIHLPCWLGPECPNFHEFLYVSGWLDVLPVADQVYDWSWSTSQYGYSAYTFRCSRVIDGRSFEVFNFPKEYGTGQNRDVYFDASSGQLVGIREWSEPACCGDGTADERWWGVQAEPCSFYDYQDQSWWEDCPTE